LEKELIDYFAAQTIYFKRIWFLQRNIYAWCRKI